MHFKPELFCIALCSELRAAERKSREYKREQRIQVCVCECVGVGVRACVRVVFGGVLCAHVLRSCAMLIWKVPKFQEHGGHGGCAVSTMVVGISAYDAGCAQDREERWTWWLDSEDEDCIHRVCQTMPRLTRMRGTAIKLGCVA